MEITTIAIEKPDAMNMILGQAHFIKTVEDIHEAMVTTVPGVEFGLGFCEASGPCLVRHSGTDKELEALAAKNCLALSTGHAFLLFLRNAYPINVLKAIRDVSEVCTVFCATANPVEVIVAETEQGRGILGVVDGYRSEGVETEVDSLGRKEFLRKIGYKLG
jgi:adenosine/AMP kinase